MLELDATRGAAMLAVILSHSATFLRPSHDRLATTLTTLGFIATPTFLLLSGVVCAHLGTRDPEHAPRVRSRLIDRGLFLLLVIHLLLGLIHTMWMPASNAIGGSFYITDAVAVGLLVAAFIGPTMKRDQLLCLGAVLLVGAWLLSATINGPHAGIFRYFERLLVGLEDSGDQDEGWIVPVLPYLGLFLIGLAAGTEYTALRARAASRDAIVRLCVGIGFASLSAGMALKIGWLAAKPELPQTWYRLLHWLTDPRAKIPPGPAYILVYGGAGLVMAGLITRVTGTARGERAVRRLAIVGRSSLFVFVLQYGLIFVPAWGFHVHGDIPFWGIALVACVICCWTLAWFWDRSNCNRLLTLRPLIGASVPRFLVGDRKT